MSGFTQLFRTPLELNFSDLPEGVLIFDVDVDPNGVWSAPQGSLAIRADTPQLWQNLDGATAWGLVGGGGGGGGSIRLVTVTPDIPTDADSDLLVLVAGPAAINLSAISTYTHAVAIVDRSGLASVNHITISPAPGETILGLSSYTINADRAAVTLVPYGTDWSLK